MHPHTNALAIHSAQLREATVFSAAFSPCGSFLVAGSSLGRVSVWILARATQSGAGAPALILTAHACCCYTLSFGEASGEVVLFTGGTDEVRAWRWSVLADAALAAPAAAPARLNAASSGVRFIALRPARRKLPQFAASRHVVPETNGLSISGGYVHAAMGDGVARTWDLASGKVIREFDGHTGFLHAIVALGASGEIATGSEDGTVRLWDVRSAGCIDVVRPSSSSGSDGSSSGSGRGRATASAAATSSSWVAALAADPDSGSNWLACAGGEGQGKGFVSWLHVPTRRTIASQPCATPVNALCLQPGASSKLPLHFMRILLAI